MFIKKVHTTKSQLKKYFFKYLCMRKKDRQLLIKLNLFSFEMSVTISLSEIKYLLNLNQK